MILSGLKWAIFLYGRKKRICGQCNHATLFVCFCADAFFVVFLKVGNVCRSNTKCYLGPMLIFNHCQRKKLSGLPFNETTMPPILSTLCLQWRQDDPERTNPALGGWAVRSCPRDYKGVLCLWARWNTGWILQFTNSKCRFVCDGGQVTCCRCGL